MATEMDKREGKEKEKESEVDPAKQSPVWTGRFQAGKWFCDCNRRARAFTVNKVSSPNHGKKFWTCPRPRGDQCNFFIFFDEEDEAKEWHSQYGPPPIPETPNSAEKKAEDLTLPKPPRTPWTIATAKRKPVSIEDSDENETGGPSNHNLDADEVAEFEDIDTPSKKVPKFARFSTPAQTFRGSLKGAAESLPTPDTGDQNSSKATGSRSRLSNRTSPPPRVENAIVLNNESEPSLTVAILNLLRSENIELKESIKILIRHEIDKELDSTKNSNKSKERTSERTISELRARLDQLERNEQIYKGEISELSARCDQLESLLDHLGVVGVDDRIDLSD